MGDSTGELLCASARLAQTLLDLAREHGTLDENGVAPALRLSPNDLAKLIGVTGLEGVG